MKKEWNISKAMKVLGAYFDPEQTDVINVQLPTSGLTACGALDFLMNHTSHKVILKKSN